MKRYKMAALAAGFIFCFTNFVLAEEPSLEVSVQSRAIFESDVEAQTDGIAVNETELEVMDKLKAFGELPIELSFKYGHTDINNDTPTFLPSHLEALNFGLGTKFPAFFINDDHYFMGVDIYPTLNTDDAAWASSAFRVPFRAYLIYKKSDDFILVGGIKIRPDYDSVVLPVLGLIYKPNDRLSFNLASDHPNIAYKLDDKTTLLWEFNYALEEYEVTRNGQKGVVLKYRDFSTGAGLEHAFTPHIKAAVNVGGVFSRRIEYRDDVGKVEPDAGLYAGGRLTANF